MSALKPGIVAAIRLSPRDALSVLDMMERFGGSDPSMTFPQMVSQVVSSMLEAYRMNGTLPDPDMFQYMNRMGKHLERSKARRRIGMASALGAATPQQAAVGLPSPLTTPLAAVMPDDLDAAFDRFLPLQGRVDVGSPLSPEESQEYRRLYQGIYPGKMVPQHTVSG